MTNYPNIDFKKTLLPSNVIIIEASTFIRVRRRCRYWKVRISLDVQIDVDDPDMVEQILRFTNLVHTQCEAQILLWLLPDLDTREQLSESIIEDKIDLTNRELFLLNFRV